MLLGVSTASAPGSVSSSFARPSLWALVLVACVTVSLALLTLQLPDLSAPRMMSATSTSVVIIRRDGSNSLRKLVLTRPRPTPKPTSAPLVMTLNEVPHLHESAADGRIRLKAMPPRGKNTIFVSVAAYRDLDCTNTLKELFTRCRFCENVFVGLVDQTRATEDEPCTPPPQFNAQTTVVRFDASLARGPTMARSVASKLWAGEEYYLQIDGHLHFVEGWDEKLLGMVPRMPSPRFIISHYPVSTVDELRPYNAVPYICKAKFEEYMKGLFSQDSGWYSISEHENIPQAAVFIGAGFGFSPATILQEVPYDPYLDFLFHGEEFIYAARAWTRGWELVVPTENVVSHVYGHRKNNAYVDHPSSGNDAEHARDRVRFLLGLSEKLPMRAEELDEYGLGNVRSLQEYEDYAGLNLANRTIAERCDQVFDWQGRIWFPKDAPRPKPFQAAYSLQTLLTLHETVPEFVSRTVRAQTEMVPGSIFVSLVSYRDSRCEDTLNELFAKCKDCDKVFVGLVEQRRVGDRRCRGPEQYRGQVTLMDVRAEQSEGPTFARYLASKLYTNQEFFFQIDSHLHFADGWDVILKDMYSKLPTKKGVISTYPVIDTTPLDDPMMEVPWICDAKPSPDSKLVVQAANAWYNVHDPALVPLNAVPGSSPFIGAGFLFGHALLLVDAPYDKYLPFLFHGEELLMAARLWTHGWDFFVPTRNVVSHLYYKRDATVYADNASSHSHNAATWKRVRYILGLESDPPATTDELEHLGLGSVRSIDEYWQFNGLDLHNLTVNNRCKQVFDYRRKVWLDNPDANKAA